MFLHPLISSNLAAIRELRVRMGVSGLDVFGSIAGSDSAAGFDPSPSDVDVFVEFLPGVSGGLNHPYLELHAALERLLGRRVDLVMTGAMTNPYFIASVTASKVRLYAAA